MKKEFGSIMIWELVADVVKKKSEFYYSSKISVKLERFWPIILLLIEELG